jgi:hypothetical protein
VPEMQKPFDRRTFYNIRESKKHASIFQAEGRGFLFARIVRNKQKLRETLSVLSIDFTRSAWYNILVRQRGKKGGRKNHSYGRK